LRLSIAWNPLLKSSRIEQWKAALVNLDPASAEPRPVPLRATHPDNATGTTQLRASAD
jgi:hypothetical protein